MATERLTQKAVERLVKNPPLEGKRQVIVWDTANPGFGLLLSKDRASFVAQGKLHGRSIRRVVGPVGLYTPQTALERANELRRQLYEGKDPAEEARRLKNSRMTLRQARDRHVELMRLKECSERSTGTLISDTDRHLAHWLNRDVRAITEAEVRELVEGLVKKAGKYQAHRTFAQLRAIYNTAIDEIGVHNDPPPNPASRAAGKVLPKTQRKRSPIPWAQLPAWDASVRELPNPIVADFLRFVLYTGLRRADAACVRWDEIDGTEWTIHRPRPKGGVDRAFTVPVSNTVIEILERRRQQNPASPWVFPANRSASGHIEEPPSVLGHSCHRLRDTFTTAALEAKVDWVAIKVLTNHTLPDGDVTAGYIRPGVEHLRLAVNHIDRLLMERSGATVPRLDPDEAEVAEGAAS
jgi:integrase